MHTFFDHYYQRENKERSMERTAMTVNGGNQELVADPVSFARSYQLEALEKALKQNTIVYFETGTGKTLIAIMLLRSYAHLLRKPSPYIAVFLVPKVVLVTQQGEAVKMHTDLKVGMYYGELGVDFWDAATWKRTVEEHEVLVMTPQILLDALRHRFVRLDQIKVLIFDECHNARRKHQYACIMTEFYHRELASNSKKLPRVFGMTASPIKAKASGCYQRLEFLGDAVLDYLITVHLYLKYPGLSPGLITDLRSASMNNDCYAQSAIKAGLYKHILHLSSNLQQQIVHSVGNFEKLCLESTFGWESETAFPKVLGDVIESLAGAIFVDSGYDKERVFQSMRPLLEPLITPETLRLHPARELGELCQKEHYTFKKPVVYKQNGLSYVTVEVEAGGIVYKETRSEANKKMAKKLACRAVLNSLKERMSTG